MKKLKNSILLLLTLSLVITATVTLSPAYASPTTLKVVDSVTGDAAIVGPEKTPGPPPYSFAVNITVTDVSGLCGFEFKLAYDPLVLESTSITLGEFFGGPDSIGTYPTGPSIVWHEEKNNDLGYAWYAVSLGTISPDYTNGKSDPGTRTLATIGLTVTGLGGTILDLVGTRLVETDGDPIWHEAVPGLFNNAKSAPVVESLEASRLDPQIGENVAFFAKAYDADYPDPDGGIIESYLWDWGDGTLPEYSWDNHGYPTPHAEHTYETIGTYVVKLTVTDNMEPIGAQGRASITIAVTAPRGLKADLVDSWPAIRNIKLTYPPEEQWWHTTINTFYADVVSLASGSVAVKVEFTVTRDGSYVTTLVTDTHTFAPPEGYLSEHRFEMAYDTKKVTGSYIVQATCRYQVDKGWVAGRTLTFKFRVTP